MPLSTYSELQASIQSWLDNSNPNLLAAIPDMIALSEMWCRRSFRVREMECRTSTPLVPDPVPADEDRGIYDLPADWGGHRSVERVDNNLVILYWRQIPTLSDAAPTNWLLEKHADLYLYGSLAQSEAWLKNDPRIPMWASSRDKVIEDIGLRDAQDRYSGGTLRSRTGNNQWWRAAGGKKEGTLEYLSPRHFFDLVDRNPAGGSALNPGYFTVTEDFLRIWPIP